MKRALLVTLTCMLFGCGENQPAKAPAPEINDIPTVEQATAALMREYSFDKVCHDSKQGFFVYFPIVDKTMEEYPWQGWYVSDKFKFYPLSNGTFVTVAIKDADFVKVHPDITGLECTTQKPTSDGSK